MNIKDLSNRVFTKMMSTPPTAHEQAQLLLGAMEAYMSKDVYMTVEQVNKKFVYITGATKDVKNIQDYAVVGRFGEVVVHEGVNSYFQLDEIKERYGMHIIQGSAVALIPADASKAGQTRDATVQMLRPLEKAIQDEAFAQWKSKFPDSKTMPDFFMLNAHPLEVKSKINNYIFESSGTSKKHAPASRSKLSAENPHLEKIKNLGGKLLIGGVWVDTYWTDIAGISEPFRNFEKTTIRMLKAKATTIGKEKGGVTLKYDWSLPRTAAKKHGEGKLFQMVGMRINAFIPMVADKKKLTKIVEKEYITRSDMGALKASSEFASEILLGIVNAYEKSIS